MKKILLLSIVFLIIIPVLINCTSPSKKPEIIESRDKLGNDISTIAPGQVVLQATVIDINKSESKTFLSILVKKVLEYGSATPPVANGSNLIVFVNDVNLNAQVYNNEFITIVMRHIPLGPGEENNTNWQILRFSK